MNKNKITNIILGVAFTPVVFVIGVILSPVLKRKKENLSKQIPSK